MKKFIVSKYSYLFKHNGNILIYNSESNTIVRISEGIYVQLKEEKDIDIKKLSNETFNNLLKYKMIVDENERMSYFYKKKLEYVRNITNTDKLLLTIVPTMGCNFNCSYCFEGEKEIGKMSDQTIDKLIHFIKRQREAKEIAIMWFGGEPLTAFKTMQKITHRIGEEIEIPIVDHQITTNGYLINDNVCDFFNKEKFSTIQITLDGNKDTHDGIRFLKNNNKRTFDRIISNIDLLLEKSPSIRIYIRVNISNYNKNEYFEVKEYLKNRFSNKVLAYPGIIRIYDKNKREFIYPSLSYKQQQEIALQDSTMLRLPSKKGCGCRFSNISAFTIGARGELYKCWEDVNCKDKIIGYLDDIKPDSSIKLQYEIAAPYFEDENCRECFFLPICDTGCPRQRVCNKLYQGKFNLCSLLKENSFLEKCMQKYCDNNWNKIIKCS